MVFKYFSSGWILMVPKHSLLKYFTLTFTGHQSSKFEGSGPPFMVGTRVPGLPVRDCARGYNNCVHTRAQISSIDMIKKILFERLYLVPGMGTFGPWVNCPYAPTTPTIYTTIISRFLCNFFPRMAPHFFGYHDSPSNLAESWYPRSNRLLDQYFVTGFLGRFDSNY